MKDYFLEENSPILTNTFAVEDRLWWIEEIVSLFRRCLLCPRTIGFRRDERGSLLACLESKNETRVDVQFGFTLVNHGADENSHCTGSEMRFQNERIG